jgi:hypothetical protein
MTDRSWPGETIERRGASNECFQYCAADTGRHQAGARLDQRFRIAGRWRPAILWLQQVDVTTARDVVGVPAWADERSHATLERQPAVAHRARQG